MDPMSQSVGQLDTTVQIVTPENIAFRYQVAGPFRRLPAYLVDLAIRVGVGYAATLLVMFTSTFVGMAKIGPGVILILWFLLAWFYGGLFETFWNGQTPGKRLMQIRVLAVDGQPINGLQAVLRNVLRAVDMQPWMFYQLGLVTAMMNDRFQRLGDLACGTMVVVEERRWFRGVVRIDEPEAIQLAGRVPAGFQVSPSLGRALAAYVQRRGYFPRLRRLEIARHLARPLQDRFGLPPQTDPDQLLCALYHRTFITDRGDEWLAPGRSPWRQARAQVAPPDDALVAAEEVVIPRGGQKHEE